MICPKCKFDGYAPKDEWSHSACHKTQAEIEAHYTLDNFPNRKIRYGAGAGTISPYPKTDPRSKAHYAK